MNRMIVSAVALSLLGGAAAAAESSVAIYGIVDAGLGYRKIDAPGFSHSKTRVVSGGASGSRWGLRGTEDLGDGLLAVFNLESGYSTANGEPQQNARLFGRQATVGLASRRWGKVDLGRQKNVASRFYGPIDPFGLGFGAANLGVAFSAANTQRLDNSVVYESPKFGGFSFGAGYSFNASDTSGSAFATADNVREITAGIKYSAGPLYLVATFDQLNGDDSKDDAATPRMYSVGGKYDFEVATLSLAYARTLDGWFVPTSPEGSAEASARIPGNAFARGFSANSYFVGFKVPLGGAASIFGSWQRVDPNSDGLTGGDATMSVYSAGASYFLSKRTDVYGYVSWTQDYAFLDGVDATALGLGIRHRF